MKIKEEQYIINDVLAEHPGSIDKVEFKHIYPLNYVSAVNFPSAVFPLLRHQNPQPIIYIPRKVESAIKRLIPSALLHKIHPDVLVAKELCLLFLNLFTSTYFHYLEDNEAECWKRLNAGILRRYFTSDPQTYLHIITALKHPLKTGSMIECDDSYVTGRRSKRYRLGDSYLKTGLKEYELMTDQAKKIYRNQQLRKMAVANENSICANLIEFYKSISLPTNAEIIAEAEKIIAGKTPLKNGKMLKSLNKHSRDYYKNTKNISFVEDSLLRYNSLIRGGLMVPTVGSSESGGRVYDSFTLMPNWIRSLVKVNGHRMVEVDYRCLHPNISMALYGGTKKYINHQQIANDAGLPIEKVKKAHLSFFNQHTKVISHTPLYGYYSANEPTVMANLIKEKKVNGYKYTSYRLLTMEVKIITSVIERLNAEGIFVGYIYDALFTEPQNEARVLELMNEISIEMGVYTEAKKVA